MPEDQIPLSDLARHYEYEKQVAAQAYLYYLEEGRPAGKEREHWARAEQAVREQNMNGGARSDGTGDGNA